MGVHLIHGETQLDQSIYRQGPDWPPYARRVLFWNWLTWFLNFADRGLIGPLLPLIILEFGISYSTAGALVSLFYVGYLSTFLGGVLADRFGRKPVIVSSVLGFGLATSATAVVGGVRSLAIVRVLTGGFEGLQYPAGAAWVSESFPYRHRALALAIWETGFSAGTLAGIALATITAAHYGWRAAWPICGIATILAALLFMRFVKERPRNETPGHDEAVALNMERGVSDRGNLRDVLRMRNVWVVFVLHGLVNFSIILASTWIPEYAIKIRHMSFTNGGLISGALFGGMTVGLVFSGYLADRIGRRRAISILSPLSALCFWGFSYAHNPFLLLMLMTLCGFFGAYIPVVIALVMDSTDPSQVGTAFGVALFGGEMGAVLGPLLGGIVAQKFGLENALLMIPTALIVAAICVWLAREPQREDTGTT